MIYRLQVDVYFGNVSTNSFYNEGQELTEICATKVYLSLTEMPITQTFFFEYLPDTDLL